MKLARKTAQQALLFTGLLLAFPGLLLLAAAEFIYPEDGDVFDNLFGP